MHPKIVFLDMGVHSSKESIALMMCSYRRASSQERQRIDHGGDRSIVVEIQGPSSGDGEA